MSLRVSYCCIINGTILALRSSLQVMKQERCVDDDVFGETIYDDVSGLAIDDYSTGRQWFGGHSDEE